MLSFATYLDDHHGDARLAIWCAAPLGAQDELIESAPESYFVPPYVGHRGWIGLRLDRDAAWGEVEAVIEDANRALDPMRPVEAGWPGPAPPSPSDD